MSIARLILPESWYKEYREYKWFFKDKYALRSYSQEGEDLILNRIFEKKPKGFFIDVGAHHPVRFSNTYLLYKRGWNGINLDAMPGSMRLFNKWRPRDISMEIAISDNDHVLTYYAFKEPAINGFSEELSKERIRCGDELLFTQEIKTKTLESVLDQFLPPGTQIDILSVDVEGHDLQVLRSNNWLKYQPSVVLVEMLGDTIEENIKSDVYDLLRQHGYALTSKTFCTAFFTKGLPSK